MKNDSAKIHQTLDRLVKLFESRRWPLRVLASVKRIPDEPKQEPDLDSGRWMLVLDNPNIPLLRVGSGATILEFADFLFAHETDSSEHVYSTLEAFSQAKGVQLASRTWSRAEVLSYILGRLTGVHLEEAKREVKALQVLSGCKFIEDKMTAKEFFIFALNIERELPAFAAYLSGKDDSGIKQMLTSN
jgi:hypothetical protein